MSMSSAASVPIAFVKALRPKQWVKNVLLFVAIVFSAKFADMELWAQVLLGFASFCCLASAGYLLNDILDREADRNHPRKSQRPIASGALPVPVALLGLVLMLVGGSALAWYLSTTFLVIAWSYLLTTLSYSLIFKHLVIVDVLSLALCYVWRAVAGAIAINVVVSEWLFLCTAFLALFIGFNKRKAEILHQGKDAGTRKILSQYTVGLLDHYQATVTGAAILSYALYTVQGARTNWLVLTLPFVLYGMFRYLYLVESQGEGEAPDETLISDVPLVISGVLFGIVAVVVIHLHGIGAFPTIGAE